MYISHCAPSNTANASASAITRFSPLQITLRDISLARNLYTAKDIKEDVHILLQYNTPDDACIHCTCIIYIYLKAYVFVCVGACVCWRTFDETSIMDFGVGMPVVRWICDEGKLIHIIHATSLLKARWQTRVNGRTDCNSGGGGGSGGGSGGCGREYSRYT
jgi:hypothetical protein